MNNIFDSLKSFSSPQAFMESAMKNNQILQSPMGQNAIQMIKNNDSKGLEEMGRNLLKERGIDPDEALKQVQSMFRR